MYNIIKLKRIRHVKRSKLLTSWIGFCSQTLFNRTDFFFENATNTTTYTYFLRFENQCSRKLEDKKFNSILSNTLRRMGNINTSGVLPCQQCCHISANDYQYKNIARKEWTTTNNQRTLQTSSNKSAHII